MYVKQTHNQIASKKWVVSEFSTAEIARQFSRATALATPKALILDHRESHEVVEAIARLKMAPAHFLLHRAASARVGGAASCDTAFAAPKLRGSPRSSRVGSMIARSAEINRGVEQRLEKMASVAYRK
jgi:hypothetical protein